MSEQPLDLRRSIHIVRRYFVVVIVVAVAGLLAGAAYTILRPPMLSSQALVVVTVTSAPATATQIVVAGSNDVLAGALANVDPPTPLLALHNRIDITSPAPGVLSITASGKTAQQAERTANAVAVSYVAYLSSRHNATEKVTGRLLQKAINATGPSPRARMITAAFVGAFAGALVGALGAIAGSRRDRRLRLRDEIADAIGVPVLASIPVLHPTDAGKWSRLLEDYQPSAATAWRLRGALRFLGLPDVLSARTGTGPPQLLSVISLSSDRRALAVGPQLAVYTASQGVPTALLIGQQRDARSTANLRAACVAPPSSIQPRSLRAGVADDHSLELARDAILTVLVTVVDDKVPRLEHVAQATVTVLALSPGVATADLLARVAASAAANGRQIDGILIADPEPADPTTGRLPQMARPTDRTRPTRVSDMTVSRRRARGSGQ